MSTMQEAASGSGSFYPPLQSPREDRDEDHCECMSQWSGCPVAIFAKRLPRNFQGSRAWLKRHSRVTQSCRLHVRDQIRQDVHSLKRKPTVDHEEGPPLGTVGTLNPWWEA